MHIFKIKMTQVTCKIISNVDNVMTLECDIPVIYGSGKQRKPRKVTGRNICVGVQMKSGKNMSESQKYCGLHQKEYEKQAEEENKKRGLI